MDIRHFLREWVVDLIKDNMGQEAALECDDKILKCTEILMDLYAKEKLDVNDIQDVGKIVAALQAAEGFDQEALWRIRCDRTFCAPCETMRQIDEDEEGQFLHEKLTKLIPDEWVDSLAWLSRTLFKIEEKGTENSAKAHAALASIGIFSTRSIILESYAEQAQDLLEENRALRQTIDMLLDSAGTENHQKG